MISSNNSNITPGSDSSELSNTSSKTTPNRRFSFNKKPINNKSISRHSSQISIITSYPTQQCDHISHDTDHTKFYSKYRGIMKDKDELPENKINDLSFEYNYDEKIRAPRMSTVSLSKLSSKDLFKSYMMDNNINNIKEEANTEVQSESSDGVENPSQKNISSYNYRPASFDLSKPVRKYSVCDGSYKDESKNYIIFDRKKSIISNTSSNASSNISPTRTTTVRKESDLTSEHSLDDIANPSRKVSNLKHIKQINEPTRLMNYVPPVLRPIEKTTFLMQKELEKPNKNSIASTTTTTTKNSNKTNETGSTSTSEILTNNSSSKTSTSSLSSMPSPVALASSPDKKPLNLFNLSFKKIPNSNSNSNANYNNNQNTHNNNNNEPSHLHWKPNSSRHSCLSCNSQFSIIKRKHHCRHCGEIFCYNCLKNLANLNLLAKFEKPCRDLTISPSLSINTINSDNNENNKDTDNNANKFNEDLNTVTSNSSHNLSYSKFSKVCPACYNSWLQFLNSNIDYEDSYKNLDDLLDKNPFLKNDRMKSITGVPTDWNWSSF